MNSEEILERHCAAHALVGSPLLERRPQPEIALDATPPTEDDTMH
jgi:hypothetical protein